MPSRKQLQNFTWSSSSRYRAWRRRFTASKRANADGLHYRIPAQADARITQGSVELLRQRLTVPQFGTIARLPGDADIGGTSAKFGITLHPSGALASYESTVSPPSAETLRGLGDAAKTTADAIKSRRDARDNQAIEELEALKKKLELERDIRKIRLELEASAE